MGICVVPWTGTFVFDDRAFRAQVRDLASALTRHLHIFGTAGGRLVTESGVANITKNRRFENR